MVLPRRTHLPFSQSKILFWSMTFCSRAAAKTKGFMVEPGSNMSSAARKRRAEGLDRLAALGFRKGKWARARISPLSTLTTRAMPERPLYLVTASARACSAASWITVSSVRRTSAPRMSISRPWSSRYRRRPVASRWTTYLAWRPAMRSSKCFSMPSSPVPSTPTKPSTCPAEWWLGNMRRYSLVKNTPGSFSASRAWASRSPICRLIQTKPFFEARSCSMFFLGTSRIWARTWAV